VSTYSTHRSARNPVDAIRLFCLECMGSSEEFGAEYAAVRGCPSAQTCSLFAYRFGTNPKHKKKVSEGSLKALATSREKRATARQRADDDK
jgi:hypothetical protein